MTLQLRMRTVASDGLHQLALRAAIVNRDRHRSLSAMVRFWQSACVALARGTIIGGWEVLRSVAEWPWPEAKAERADGTLARLTVLPAGDQPSPAELHAWRTALAPPTLDHPGFPGVRGLGLDADRGVVWIARVWSPWSSYATIATGHPPLPVGRRGAALASLGAALVALHAAGCTHGGLAAARVLLSRADGSACEVLDLGLDVVAAGLGLTPSGPVHSFAVGAVADLRGFAAIVDHVIAVDVRQGAPWRPALEAWIARHAASGADAPPMAEAVAALAALLPAPDAEAEPPVRAPSPEELVQIEAAQLARAAAARERAERDDRGQRPSRRVTGPQEPAFVAPIVVGGAAVDPDIWPWMIRARRPAAAFTYDPGSGVLVTGSVTWMLGSGQRVAAADGIADAIVRAVDAQAGERGPGELEAELAAAGFSEVVTWAEPPPRDEPRPRGTRWWQGPGMRALVTGQRVTLQRERRRRLSPHQVATVGEDVVHLATAELPRSAAARRELLSAALAVISLIDQRPAVTHVCRFCHASFDTLHFRVHLGACHPCSALHLGVSGP